MAKFRKIKPKISKRKKIILLFVVVSLLFVSGGYSILGSDVGLLGTLFVNKYKNMPVIQSFSSDDTTKFRSSTYRTKIETITLSESISPPEGYIESWNLGINGKSNVMGYITKRSDADIYDLYIQGDGNLYANPDSSYLFYNLSGVKQINGLNLLDTSLATNMSSMFAGCNGMANLDVSGFDTGNVTTMYRMFYHCNKLTSLDLSSFNTSKVTTMNDMFSGCSSLISLDISFFIMSNVTNMNSIFYECRGLTSLVLGNLDTSKVTDIGGAFRGCSKLTSLDLSGINTSKVESMAYLFYGCSGLKSLNLSNFNTSNVTNMSSMFSYCSGLTSLDVSGFDTSSVTDMSSMFSSCIGLTSLIVSGFDTSKVIDMSFMFYDCFKLTNLDLNTFDTNNVVNMRRMFGGGLYYMRLSEITMGDKWNTSSVKDMSYMFSNFNVSISQQILNKLNTSNVTNMSYMFSSCSGLTSLDLSGFDTSNVTDMSYMFGGENYKYMNLSEIKFGSKWNTINVVNMNSMFYKCNQLNSLDLSCFDTRNVTNMSSMFSSCSNLYTILVSTKWSVANVIRSSSMFYGCTKISGSILYDSSKTDKSMANYDTGYLSYVDFTGIKYTNSMDATNIFVNKTLPFTIGRYNSGTDAMTSLDNHAVYLKHFLEANIVKKSCIEFKVTSDMVQKNSTLVEGMYTLCPDASLSSNEALIKKAFGNNSTYCNYDNSFLLCDIPGVLYASASSNSALVDDYFIVCTYGDGVSTCSQTHLVY